VKSTGLARDYLLRAQMRLKAVEVLVELGAWADVVRESQEIVELALKGLLRHYRIQPPRVHDVSEVVEEQLDLFPKELRERLPAMLDISRQLRRDRELAFYGTEDLTPSEFYRREDADRAIQGARFVLEHILAALA
jgi:HEPN domain-containing protein